MFKKFRDALFRLLNVIPAKVREIASRSLHITTAIKTILDNPATDILTAIIPGTWDDKLKQIAVNALNEAIPYLQVVDKCKQHTEIGPMLQCWIEEVQQMPKHARNAMLHKLAALLTSIMDGSERKQNEYDYYIQMLYSSNKYLKNEQE